MNKKYKNLNALEDEDVRAITGGTIRKPKKMFNMLHHHRKHRKRLYEKYFSSSKGSLADASTTLDLTPDDYCKKCEA